MPTEPDARRDPARIDLKTEIERSEWQKSPVISFDQRAPYTIAQSILALFGGVYLLGFIGAFVLLGWKDTSFDKGSDLIKFMVQLPLPLVTLAVGYYLGDRNRPQPTRKR